MFKHEKSPREDPQIGVVLNRNGAPIYKLLGVLLLYDDIMSIKSDRRADFLCSILSATEPSESSKAVVEYSSASTAFENSPQVLDFPRRPAITIVLRKLHSSLTFAIPSINEV
jgi:hypothetical protein